MRRRLTKLVYCPGTTIKGAKIQHTKRIIINKVFELANIDAGEGDLSLPDSIGNDKSDASTRASTLLWTRIQPKDQFIANYASSVKSMDNCCVPSLRQLAIDTSLKRENLNGLIGTLKRLPWTHAKLLWHQILIDGLDSVELFIAFSRIYMKEDDFVAQNNPPPFYHQFKDTKRRRFSITLTSLHSTRHRVESLYEEDTSLSGMVNYIAKAMIPSPLPNNKVPGHLLTILDISFSKAHREDLLVISQLDSLVALDVTGICDPRNPEESSLDDTVLVSWSMASSLGRLKKLSVINITQNNKITKAGVERLLKLPKLVYFETDCVPNLGKYSNSWKFYNGIIQNPDKRLGEISGKLKCIHDILEKRLGITQMINDNSVYIEFNYGCETKWLRQKVGNLSTRLKTLPIACIRVNNSDKCETKSLHASLPYDKKKVTTNNNNNNQSRNRLKPKKLKPASNFLISR